MPRKGGEIDLKPCAYIRSELYVRDLFPDLSDGVPFVEWTGELPSVAWLSQ